MPLSFAPNSKSHAGKRRRRVELEQKFCSACTRGGSARPRTSNANSSPSAYTPRTTVRTPPRGCGSQKGNQRWLFDFWAMREKSISGIVERTLFGLGSVVVGEMGFLVRRERLVARMIGSSSPRAVTAERGRDRTALDDSPLECSACSAAEPSLSAAVHVRVPAPDRLTRARGAVDRGCAVQWESNGSGNQNCNGSAIGLHLCGCAHRACAENAEPPRRASGPRQTSCASVAHARSFSDEGLGARARFA